MLKKIEEYFYKRFLQRRKTKVEDTMPLHQKEFIKVKNTLIENRVMILTKEDGIYIRFASNGSDTVFMEDFVKVVNC